MHVHGTLLDDDNAIKQADLDLVARLGANWYCRVTADNLFEIPKPLRTLGIGVDSLPEHIRLSPVLTGNHLGQLANVESIPMPDVMKIFQTDKDLEALIIKLGRDKPTLQLHLHRRAADYLDQGRLAEAWQVLLINT